MSKQAGKKSFEVDAARMRVLLNDDFGGAAYLPTHGFIPAIGGNEGGTATRRTFMDDNTNRGVQINSSGDQVSGIGMIPAGAGSVSVYPIFNCSTSGSVDYYYSLRIDTYLSDDSTSPYTDTTLNYSGGFNWATGDALGGTVEPGGILNPYIQASGTPSAGNVYILGWTVLYSS